MEEHHIDFTYSGRYYTHGRYSASCKNVWFVLHGYGQLAKYFIKKFEVLDPEKNFIVAPEGTNRFYLQGFEGRVGATWMTKEDRENDIKNYLNFLNTLYKKLIPSNTSRVKINVLGFSQGAATASRWLADGVINAERLILWAGIFPPDLERKKARKELATKQIVLVAGRQDEYIKPERLEEMRQISTDLDVQPLEIWYDGGHQIDTEVVKELSKSY